MIAEDMPAVRDIALSVDAKYLLVNRRTDGTLDIV
jgi:hypothetical protein